MPPTNPVFTDANRVGDFVKFLGMVELYHYETWTIKNMTGVAVAANQISPGQPLRFVTDHYETIDVGEESQADGFYADQRQGPALAIGATSTLQYKILVRGPAVVNGDAFPVDADNTTGAYSKSALIAALGELNPPIVVVREPSQTTTMSG